MSDKFNDMLDEFSVTDSKEQKGRDSSQDTDTINREEILDKVNKEQIHPDDLFDENGRPYKTEKCNVYNNLDYAKSYQENIDMEYQKSKEKIFNEDDDSLFAKMFREANGRDLDDNEKIVTDDGEELSKDTRVIVKELFDEWDSELVRNPDSSLYKTGYFEYESEMEDYRFRYSEPVYLGRNSSSKFKLYRIASERIYNDLYQSLSYETKLEFDNLYDKLFTSLENKVSPNVTMVRTLADMNVGYDFLVFSRLLILLAYPLRLNPVYIAVFLATKKLNTNIIRLGLPMEEFSIHKITVFSLRKYLYNNHKDVVVETDFLLDMYSLELNFIQQMKNKLSDIL